MGLLSGIGGALVGFATGGPIGAIAGGVGGLLSGGGQTATSTTQLQYRPYTPEELQMIQAAYASIQANMQAMTPEQRENYIGQLANTYYEPIAQEIDTQYKAIEGQTRVAYGRGGMLGSSFSEASQRQMASDTARAKASAYAQARQAGEQSYFGLEQSRRANLGTAQNLIGNIENLRRTGQMQTTQYPNQFPTDLMGSLGWATSSPYSYFNTNLREKLPDWLVGNKKLNDDQMKLLNYRWW